MKLKLLSLFLGLLSVSSLFAAGHPAVNQENRVSIKNGVQTVSFDLDRGLYSIQNAAGQTVVNNAYFQLGGLQSKEPFAVRTYTKDAVNDELGSGQRLTVKAAFEDYADIVWQVTLYDGKDYAVFNMGVDNDTDTDYRLLSFWPLITKELFAGADNKEGYRILDGVGGGGRTLVKTDDESTTINNLMFRFGTPGNLNIVVAGGLTYREFEKFVTARRYDKRFALSLFAEDPVGKLVAARATYLPNERFYLCLNDKNQFEALEKYGQTLKTAQKVKLNMYDFPTECLWYAAFYNNEKGRDKFNDSKGAVDEMNNAIQTGITNYTRVSVRLVPDTYTPNNQQGWWDDEHWAMYGEKMSTKGNHHVEPYMTTKSWAGAMCEKGGVPITYFQSGRRSEDFVKIHPEYMLFNDPYRVINQPSRFMQHVKRSEEYGEYGFHWWTDKRLWGYDFTDPGFIKHVQSVYAKLKDAGIKGVMYDYPEETAWAFEGGFEDKTVTTAWAYRNMYQLAYDGLGSDCYLDERCILKGSDLTLGLVASQRVWADTDGITPEMVTRCGLRWYKNRVVVNYDMDSKDPSDALPLEHSDGNRSMLTMCYVTGGRFLLGRSFKQLSKEQLYDLSRSFPYHSNPQSARPLDAFNDGVEYPRVYDFKVNEGWHQLTFYNYNLDAGKPKASTIEVALSKSQNEGGMELNADKEYYVYDFWNDALVGRLKGSETLKQTLRIGEARMMSVHEVQRVPQFISTNRHLMQGYIDLKDCTWNAASGQLTGVSEAVGGDTYTVVVATNGMKPVSCQADKAKISFAPVAGQEGLINVSLACKKNETVKWSVKFK